MKESRIRALCQQYVEGKLTSAEEKLFFSILQKFDGLEVEDKFFTEDETDRMLQYIKRQLEK